MIIDESHNIRCTKKKHEKNEVFKLLACHATILCINTINIKYSALEFSNPWDHDGDLVLCKFGRSYFIVLETPHFFLK